VYPSLPYPGCSWRLNHHMGIVTAEHLYHILWAANTYSHSSDPAAEINNYLVANRQLTPNIREDSGQPDAWRDYQQILSELGLTYSLEVLTQIKLTPLGLALLDGLLGFSEVMALQALRFQYPNGHHVAFGPTQADDLLGSPFGAVSSNVELQNLSGIRLRPAVLVWRVLRGLATRGQADRLTTDDIERYLMPCATHSDTEACIDAIVSVRSGGLALPGQGQRQRRNAQDWIKFLRLTPIFEAPEVTDPALRISSFGLEHADEIDRMCDALERPETFWEPASPLTQADRLRWYSEFGVVDLSLPELPGPELPPLIQSNEYVAGREEEEDADEGYVPAEAHIINLTAFDFGPAPPQVAAPGTADTIESVYRAELTTSQHRLHDQLVLLIGRTCRAKGADVYEDPNSVDLLVHFRATEFIIEVKSVTPKNFIARLRYALGQVLHYDYLRSAQAEEPRRKVIALAAKLPNTSWSIPFVRDYLDMDLLSLEAGALRLHSRSSVASQLFA